MDALTGNNPTNNPRLDLLHNTGENQQLSGAAGSYGPVNPNPAPPPEPTPAPNPGNKPVFETVFKPAPATSRTQISTAPRSAASYVASAEAAKPPTPVSLPKPTSTAEPRFASVAAAGSAPQHPSRRTSVLVGAGVLILLALAGGSWWWLTKPGATPAPSTPVVAAAPVAPTGASQAADSGTIAPGKTITQTSATFSFDIPTKATKGTFTPEIELQPLETAFTGAPTTTGDSVVADGRTLHVSLSANNLKAGSYHWQVRDSVGSQHSSWVAFGSAGQVAFIVTATAPSAPVVTAIAGGAVTNPTTVTTNQPPITGTAAPNATVSVNIAPDSQSFTTTADGNGAWSLTPSTAIPNGQHTLSITATDGTGSVSTPVQVALTINPATVAQAAPAAGVSGAPAATPPKPVSSNLAATGDNTTLVGGLALSIMMLAAAGMLWLRRRYAAF